MARPLRIHVADGWYHVTARGTDRRVIFTDEHERRHFLDLLAEMVGRFRVVVHSYVLMGNHYHLLVQTPKANLSQTVQWLNTSYSMWFNRRHDRVGPLFQGRYKGVLVDGEGSWALVASVYIHLNPVRTAALGMGKQVRKAEAAGVGPAPDREVIMARLRRLREYRWSSYRVCAGYEPAPEWLTTAVLWNRSEGPKQRAPESYRRYVEDYVKQGEKEEPATRAKASWVLGTEAFLGRVRKLAKGDRREQKELRRQNERSFEDVVRAVESVRGERLEVFRDRQGDAGRDIILSLARATCGLTLRELGRRIGGMDYVAVSMAIQRMKQRLKSDAKAQALFNACKAKLYNV